MLFLFVVFNYSFGLVESIRVICDCVKGFSVGPPMCSHPLCRITDDPLTSSVSVACDETPTLTPGPLVSVTVTPGKFVVMVSTIPAIFRRNDASFGKEMSREPPFELNAEFVALSIDPWNIVGPPL